MFVASYSNTMRGARAFAARRETASRPTFSRSLFPEVVPPTPAKLLAARVLAWHGLTFQDAISYRHRVKWRDARRDAIVAVKLAYPRLSLPALGRIFRRDHTTILYHLRKAGVA